MYALADLHLSHAAPKPMDGFGPQWEGHVEKLAHNWRKTVGEDDLVVVAGDVSWAMKLDGARPDLEWLSGLPGTKLLVRGNHDYWWPGITRLRQNLPPRVHALQNDHFVWQGITVCGTRGWACPGSAAFDPEPDGRLYARELERLALSLRSAALDGRAVDVVALHFPPTNEKHEESGFTRLLADYQVGICVYGHLHGVLSEAPLTGLWGGTRYFFVAADHVGFTPVMILPAAQGGSSGILPHWG